MSFDKVNVDSIPSIEKNFNSRVYVSRIETVESTKDSIILYGKLKHYSRPENKSFGKVDVIYYYLKDDSIVRKIEYYWVTSKDSKLKDYSRQFDKTVKKISTDLGLPIGEQGKLLKIMDDTIEGKPEKLTERRVVWDYNGAKILIIMAWSEKQGAYLNTQIEWNK